MYIYIDTHNRILISLKKILTHAADIDEPLKTLC